jgi:hypothetical protein
MSGCVYKSIYKADDEILALFKEGKIDYQKGCLVDRVVENETGVTLTYFDDNDVAVHKVFDKVFFGRRSRQQFPYRLKFIKFTKQIRSA